MINGDHLINDGLATDRESCDNNGKPTWTHNQAVVLGAVAEFHKANLHLKYLATGLRLANASTTSMFLNPGGVLKEPCDPDCTTVAGDPSAPTFKGVYMRNLMELNHVVKGTQFATRFANYFERQVEAIEAQNKNDKRQYGFYWNGPFDKADAMRQQSAVEALLALGSVMS